MAGRPRLRELADRCGILPGYERVDGQWQETSTATMEALLAAMGFDAASEAGVERQLARLGPVGSDGRAEEARCLPAHEVLGDRRVFGLQVNLYSVRSAANWGIGDFGDLRRLVDWASDAGAAFVAVNPLQATGGGGDGNPYFPSSRLFLEPVYLDVDAIADSQHCAAARAILDSAEWCARRGAARTAANLDWRQLNADKVSILRLLHRESAQRGGTVEGLAVEFARYRSSQGRALDDFATFCALAERVGRGVLDWRTWPAGFRRRDAPAVAAFRRECGDEVEFHAYLQFALDRQLGRVAAMAAEAAMPIGLFGDLPIGCAPGGADTWMFPELFAAGVTLGAPPDAYATAGQDWGLAALLPQALARPEGNSYWSRVLRAAMRHCGALRIDHAMGVERQFWIPDGQPPEAGAYVAYPTGWMVSAIAAASRDNRCIVVAEDLGTVPADFRPRLKRWRILRNQILYFEQSPRRFHPVEAYDVEALAAANTHDLAPLAGFWTGADLDLRQRAGLYRDETEVAAARAERERGRAALAALLREERLLPDEWDGCPPAALVGAAYAFLAATPARLLAVALDDLGGEIEPVNLPGAAPAAHRSWVRRMTMSLEDLASSATVAQTLARLASMRRRCV